MIDTQMFLAVLGYGKECSQKNAAIASALGKLAGKQNMALVAGNVSATFNHAFQSASDLGSETICIIEKHKRTAKEHRASKIVRTKDTHQKHSQIAQMADAAVLIGGGAGSQMLLNYFIKNHKTVVAIKGSGGIADSSLPHQVLVANNAKEAFQLLNSCRKKCQIETGLGLLQLNFDHFGLDEAKIVEMEMPFKCEKETPFASQFQDYIEGRNRIFAGKIHLKGTSFQLKVWKALVEIPFGQTMQYGELAEKIGDKNAGRAVGKAAGQNPIWILIPCHRLLGKNGSLTGYAGGLEMKMRLLDLEKNQTELNIF